jgi:hypothetical protein
MTSVPDGPTGRYNVRWKSASVMTMPPRAAGV